MVKKISKSYGRELSKAKERLWKHRDKVLHGTLLAIDPSCVSTSSVPGYALYRNGEFIEGGTLNIKFHTELHIRLSRIRNCIQSNFADVDVVIIEKPPVKPLFTRRQAADSGRIWMNAVAHNSLMQAVGAFKCSFPEDIPVIDLAAGVWTHTAKTHGFKLDKSDSEDAIAIGMAAVTITRELIDDK